MENKKSKKISLEEAFIKRLDRILVKNKAENEALKKILVGLGELEKNNIKF